MEVRYRPDSAAGLIVFLALRASSATAVAKNTRPIGPTGGPCNKAMVDTASSSETVSGAPAWRNATAAARMPTAYAMAPTVDARSAEIMSSQSC
jgi:hypothetical protein